jgi:hypothetical protein
MEVDGSRKRPVTPRFFETLKSERDDVGGYFSKRPAAAS